MAVPTKIMTTATSQSMSTFRMPLRTSRPPGIPSPCAGDLYVVLVVFSGQAITAPPDWNIGTIENSPGQTGAAFWKILDKHDTAVCFTGDSDGDWYAEGYIALPPELDEETTKSPLPAHT